MPYGNFILDSIKGRRLGLQRLTTTLSGAAKEHEFLVGPDGFREETSTADTTAVNLKAFGYHYLPGTSAASSAVYTIEPPIPGIRVFIFGSASNGPTYLKTANGETIQSSAGSTFTTVKISSIGGGFEMFGLTTAIWASELATGTSSQASGFGLTTTT